MTTSIFAIASLIPRSNMMVSANKHETWDLIRECGIVKNIDQCRVLMRILADRKIESGDVSFIEEVISNLKECLKVIHEDRLLLSKQQKKIEGIYEVLIALGIACYSSEVLNEEKLSSYDKVFVQGFRSTSEAYTSHSIALPLSIHTSALELFPFVLDKRKEKLSEDLILALLLIGNHSSMPPWTVQKGIFEELRKVRKYDPISFLKVMNECMKQPHWKEHYKILALFIMQGNGLQRARL